METKIPDIKIPVQAGEKKQVTLLKGKKILLISPQPWTDMWISKHHYAVELCRLGNTVYFLNPPSTAVSRGKYRVSFQPVPNLQVIDYRPVFPMRWKYRFPTLFNNFMRFEVNKIVSLIGGAPDIVWDFEPNRQFKDLNWFKAGIKIYHPVDATPFMNGDTKNADIVFSVSNVILDYFQNSNIPRHFINHGLGGKFREVALDRLAGVSEPVQNKQLRFGYIGNLLMQYIDHDLFMRVIAEHPHIQFHIWGPYDYSRLAVEEPDATKIRAFIDFLKSQAHVHLYGLQSHEVILTKMTELDGFFWCYDNQKDPNKGSNSHKLLEYLSSGKVIVSTYVSTYDQLDKEGIMVMSKTRDGFMDNFYQVVNNMAKFNSPEWQCARINFALANTYSSQLANIDSLLLNIQNDA